MSPNGSDISIVVNNDPSWETQGIAARSNRPNFVDFLRGPAKYHQGHEFQRAAVKEVADRLASIHDGRAEKDLLPVAEQKLTNQESVDFNATAGMVAGITEKAKALPDREVFHPIMTGFGTVDRAAIDSWRIFVTSSSPALGQQPRTLGRGISL